MVVPPLPTIESGYDFLPRAFGVVGRRLVFSVGILFLSVAAGILLILFGGNLWITFDLNYRMM